jgi:hypothetical protein
VEHQKEAYLETKRKKEAASLPIINEAPLQDYSEPKIPLRIPMLQFVRKLN